MNFKDIVGYEGRYQISDTGVIKSLGNQASRKEKQLRTNCKQGKYPTVDLWLDGEKKRKSVHRLVAEHFLPNPDNKPIVNHIDENTLNFHYSNLEWCSQPYNVLYSKRLRAIDKIIKKYKITREELEALLP